MMNVEKYTIRRTPKHRTPSEKNRRIKKVFSASFTVEAALALSLMIFASVALMVPMIVLNQQINASIILEDSARTVSKLKYIEYYAGKKQKESNEGKKDGIELKELAGDAEVLISAAALTNRVTQAGMKNVDLLSESDIDSTKIHYVLNYEAEIPFSILGLGPMHQQVVAYRRAWIGADGNRWMENNGGQKEDDGDEIVYISLRDTKVYHTTLDCSYMSHDILQTTGAAIQEMRTQYGGRFSPCAVCMPSKNLEKVYYTSGARSYHSTAGCRTMSSYIQQTTKKEALASGKHGCIRCGK